MSVSIEDRLAIVDLFTAYARAVDDGDPAEDLQRLVTDDIVLTGRWSGVHEGRDAVRAWARSGPPVVGTSRHLICNIVADPVDGEHVTATADYFHLVTAGAPGSSAIRAAGRYECVLRRTDSGWRFARRHAVIDGTTD